MTSFNLKDLTTGTIRAPIFAHPRQRDHSVPVTYAASALPSDSDCSPALAERLRKMGGC